MNEYYQELLAVGWKPDGILGFYRLRDTFAFSDEELTLWKHRPGLVAKYAFAIPNTEAVETCVRYGPILEIGCGMGYWAYLIRKAGGKIVAVDYKPGVLWETLGKGSTWVDVEFGDENTVDVYPHHTLMVCWPPMDSMAARALAKTKAANVIYIGEGFYGCTADDEFHTRLEEEWEEVERVKIPQWTGVHDMFLVYQRK